LPASKWGSIPNAWRLSRAADHELSAAPMSSPERRSLPVLTSRRAFVCDAARALASGAVVGMSAPLLAAASQRASAPSPGAPRGTVDVSSLTADEQWLVAPWMGPDGAPVLIVRRTSRQYSALSMQCTHMGCPINPPVHGIMTCPCHGSQFDLAGHVRHGPAQFPLGQYATTYHPATHIVTVTLQASD
jgi:Rieske Fe-S protein